MTTVLLSWHDRVARARNVHDLMTIVCDVHMTPTTIPSGWLSISDQGVRTVRDTALAHHVLHAREAHDLRCEHNARCQGSAMNNQLSDLISLVSVLITFFAQFMPLLNGCSSCQRNCHLSCSREIAFFLVVLLFLIGANFVYA